MIPDPKENIWEHSEELKALCRRRASGTEPEMDSAAQCAEMLSALGLSRGAPLLDGGCGAGHFIHSLKKRGLELDYYGLDYSPSYIQIGKEAFAELSFGPERLILESLEDLSGREFAAAVLIKVLSFNYDYRSILCRLDAAGAEAVVIRDNFGPETRRLRETDGYLDPGWNHLEGWWNRGGRGEMEEFLGDLGWSAEWIEDRRTKGEPELVVGKPYTWGFLLAKKR